MLSKFRLFFWTLFVGSFFSCGKVNLTVGGNPSGASNCAASFTSQITGAEVGVGSPDLGGSDIAQSFKVSGDTTNITQVQLKLVALGSPGGNLTLRIEGDSGNAPDGAPLAQSTLAVSNIKTSPANFYLFTFTPVFSLSATKTYWLRLQPSYSASRTDLIQWMGNNQDAYPLGKALYRNNLANTWENTAIGATRDLLFKVGC